MSTVFRENMCIFQKVVHKSSGLELPQGYLLQGIYIESMELNGPKIILVYNDPEQYISGKIKIKEYDELTISYGDAWAENGVSEQEDFVVLTCTPVHRSKHIEISCMAKMVYELKKINDKAKIFKQRGVLEILKAIVLKGMKFDIKAFPVINDYHLPPGMRPTTMLRQIAKEMGAQMWYSRNTIHMCKFEFCYAQSPEMTFEYGKIGSENSILKYEKPSEQVAAQETKLRVWTGWDEKKGRVSTPLDNPLLSKIKGVAKQFYPGGNNPWILANALVGTKVAIDFIASGSFAVEPGKSLALRWHQANPQDPLNENLPDKIVVDTVSHFYAPQKYAIRVKGAVPLEPF